MKPPKFHVGQAVVCTQDHCFKALIPENPGCKMPERGPIYRIASVYASPMGLYGITLVELPLKKGWFSELRFAPAELLPDESLAQLLEETLEPVNA